MNRLVKVVSILLIVAMISITLSNVVLATGVDTVIKDMDAASYNSAKVSGVKSIAQDVLSAIRTISIIVAVVMISILGVKYMMGSAEEKAGYKKSLVPLLVGAILVFGAAAIAKVIVGLAGTFAGK